MHCHLCGLNKWFGASAMNKFTLGPLGLLYACLFAWFVVLNERVTVTDRFERVVPSLSVHLNSRSRAHKSLKPITVNYFARSMSSGWDGV